MVYEEKAYSILSSPCRKSGEPVSDDDIYSAIQGLDEYQDDDDN